MGTTASPNTGPAPAEYAGPSLLDRIVEDRERIGARYMPTLTVQQFAEREKQLAELKSMLVGPTKETPEGVDYGVIPGTAKPTLYKAGAEKICTFFGYAPVYTVEKIEDWDGSQHAGEPLFYYNYTCTLMKDGKPVGQSAGSCNSWESKYRYRISKRVCPSCGVAALIEGKQFRPGDPKQWVCFEKKGGCKAKFAIDDKRITEQAVGRVANPDFADVINTVQKIAQKRAYVGACLSATGASQYFTQDMEDLPHEERPVPPMTEAQPTEAPVDDPVLAEYLRRAQDGKESSQEVFHELFEKIKKATDEDTAKLAWANSQKQVDGKTVLRTDTTRSLYKFWLGVAEPKPEVL